MPGERIIRLVRHGETEWNVLGRRQGRLDSPLTPRGVAQAERLADALVGAGIERIRCSPMGRAATTARIVGDRLGLTPVVLPELAEVDHGSWSGRTTADLQGEPAWADRIADPLGWRFPGGESYADAADRAASAIAALRDDDASSTLVVSHEMIGRMLVGALVGEPTSASLARAHPHDAVLRWSSLTPTTVTTLTV